MSYEGTEEYLCEKGHYHTEDAGRVSYEGMEHKVCPHCQSRWAWHCSIDETNGYDAQEPCTFKGPKKQIGSEDVPQTDHRGNKYFLELLSYEPIHDGNRWFKIGD